MKKYLQGMFIAAVAGMLLGCGGGGGNDTTPDGNNPNPTGTQNPETNQTDTSEDTTPPVVTLNGSAEMSLFVDRTYTELGATATDDSDGDITSSIVISGEVNTSKVGTYTLTYTATDSAGNSGSATRTVHVLSMLKKTGQTKSYDEYGNEVTDGSIKDDGYYQKGVTPSYTRDDTKEIVTDNITGLMWQDDADASSVTKNWSDAKTYCENLTLGGYTDWRLPSIDELEGIVDFEHYNPAIDPTFQHVTSYFYWSSTTYAVRTDYAWIVNFGSGYSDGGGKTRTSYVRCVRAGQ